MSLKESYKAGWLLGAGPGRPPTRAEQLNPELDDHAEFGQGRRDGKKAFDYAMERAQRRLDGGGRTIE